MIAHSNGPKGSLRFEATKAGVPTVRSKHACAVVHHRLQASQR